MSPRTACAAGIVLYFLGCASAVAFGSGGGGGETASGTTGTGLVSATPPPAIPIHHSEGGEDVAEGIADVVDTYDSDGTTSAEKSPSVYSTRGRERAFVCITGQLPRLELRNKMDHLLIPLVSNFGVDVDVALVLSGTDNHSVNRKGERSQKYYSFAEAAAELNALEGVTVLNDSLDDQSMDPVVNPKYLKQRAEGSSMSDEQMLERVKNHVRQFEGLARCHYHMVNSGRDYDMVHRVREDSGYYRPVDYDTMKRLISSPGEDKGEEGVSGSFPDHVIVTSGGCDIHGGINDRGAFVSPPASYDYFNHPVLHMYLRPLPDDVRNTEQFLKVTYERTSRLVSTEEFHIFRIWDAEDIDAEMGGGNSDDGTLSEGGTVFSPSDILCIQNKGLDDSSSQSGSGGKESKKKKKKRKEKKNYDKKEPQ